MRPPAPPGPRGKLLLLLLAGCSAHRPWMPPVGEPLAASLYVAPADAPGEHRVVLAFHAATVPPQAPWEGCSAGAPDRTDAGPPLAGGEAWLVVDGARGELPRIEHPFAEASRPAVALEPGARVGAGWAGGADVPAYAGDDAISVLPPLVVTSPPGGIRRGIRVRWEGSSDGAVLVYARAGDARVSCAARDDGRFRIPARAARALHGPGALEVVRVVDAWPRLADGAYARFAWWDRVEVPVEFEGR